jgi:23S rRNA pseudouridine1911/1915/1917 synthase
MRQLDKESYFKILFEDNHILVVIKSYGISTQDDNTNISLEKLLKNFYKKKLNKKSIFLHPVHRVDKNVYGLVLFAKSSKALSRLNEEMRDKKIKKKYIAIVENYFEKKEGILKDYISHEEFYAKVSDKKDKNNKEAVLEYKVVDERDDLSLVEINLITGRYHQIRAQMAFHNHPILGDKKYGSKKSRKNIALESYFLEFLHPTLKKKVEFQIESELKL